MLFLVFHRTNLDECKLHADREFAKPDAPPDLLLEGARQAVVRYVALDREQLDHSARDLLLAWVMQDDVLLGFVHKQLFVTEKGFLGY